RLRNKARLKFLLEAWGPERFREVLETEYLGYALPDGPPPPPSSSPGAHVGVHRQKDGRSSLGASPTVGRVGGGILSRLGELVDQLGADGVRLTAHQKLVLLGVPADRVEEAVAALEEMGLSTRPGPFRRSTIACTGIEYCKLAIVDTKDTAARVVDRLEQRLADLAPLLEQPLSLHVNGCPNSCARIQTADIGFKGQIV